MFKRSGERIIISFCLIIILFFIGITRIFIINNSGYRETATKNNSYRLHLSNLRGTIFDTNMLPITNSETKTVAVFTPTETAVTAASALLDEEAKSYVLDSLKKGKPVSVTVEKPIDAFGVFTTKVYVNTPSDLICPQLIGYIDVDSKGAAGIQKTYEDVLYSNKKHTVSLAKDGLGNILSGAEITEDFDESVINSGLSLTINSDIQRLAASSMSNVSSGAMVITEIGTGKIRAMVSVPEFDATNVAEFLNADNSPLLNKGISAYNVGSVFKPSVAAALIESGKYKNEKINCTGSNKISGHSFHCHNLSGHGIVDRTDALAFSCNSFFYNISVKLGTNSIYNMASALRFGTNYEIAKGIKLAGSLPKKSELTDNTRGLVNLSIGQGKLLLSPVAILSLYEAVANGGVYYQQTVIEGVVKNGVITQKKKAVPVRVMSEETANILKEDLKKVIEYGTGKSAKPSLTSGAGKTATAETGWKKNGSIIKNSWFCGFFPYENPKYAVSILIEDSKGGEDVAAPIFAKIADSITLLENSKK